MSPASRIKIPRKKQPDINKPVPLGFDPTQASPPPRQPVHRDTLRLYEPGKKVRPLSGEDTLRRYEPPEKKKAQSRRHRVRYPTPEKPEFNKGRL